MAKQGQSLGRVLLLGTFALLVVSRMSTTVRADPVVQGIDLWDPRPGPDTFIRFGSGDVPGIPADFFDPGSDPIAGGGDVGPPEPMNPPGATRMPTIIRRPTDASFSSSSTETIPIEIVQMSLESAEPITVTYAGTQPPEQWDFRITLTPSTTSNNGYTTLEDEGTSSGQVPDSFFDITYEIEFERVGDGATRSRTDTIHLDLVSPVPFSHTEPPGVWTVAPGELDALGTSNFFVGADEFNLAAPLQSFVYISPDGGLSVEFATATPEPGTLVMLAGGVLAGLALGLRRRRAAKRGS